MKRAVIIVLLLGIATTAFGRTEQPPIIQAVLEAEAARVAVMNRAKEAVVAVFSPGGKGGGSGVVVTADGYALTNFHVVKPCGNAMKCGMADGKLYDAVIVGIDPAGDIALIKLFGRDDFPCAEPADSDLVQPGDWCFAMGNPFMLATDFQPTVTYGIVSGVHRYQYPAGTLLEYTDCIQTDASINPGNSGGPLFDARGRLIGINGRASFEKRGRVNVGVAYAVSINQIKNFMGHLRSGRIVDHATLGATVAPDEDGRVVVGDILENCDAYRRGLRYDDEVVSFGGRPISTPNDLKNVLGIFPKGWRVPLSFRRDGRRHDVLVRLAGLHTAEELLSKIKGRLLPSPKPGEKPKLKLPKIPLPGGGPKKTKLVRPRIPMPEIVKKHFQQKRGYANYYFNKLNRQRVLKAWAEQSDTADCGGAWTLAGELSGGGAYRFELTDSGARLELPSAEFQWAAGDESGASLEPPQSGGLLLALYLWRRLALLGPEQFGEVSYLGAFPVVGRKENADVLLGLHGGVECRFLFDPADGRLLAVEMFATEDADPCEVLFTEYRELNGRLLPSRMEVRHGDDLYGVFKIDANTF